MFQRIIAISIILLLLALSGCVQPETEEPGFLQGGEGEPLDFTSIADPGAEPEPAPIPGNCEAMETQFDKDSCVFNTALEESDISQCLNLLELWQRNNCVSIVAAQNLDTSLCNNMKSAFSEDNTNPRNSCIAEVALGALYTDECKQLTDDVQWEQRCWGRVEQICSEIVSQSWREACIKKSAIDVGVEENCLSLHGFERDTCLEEIAVQNQRPATCDLIEDETIKESCLGRASRGYFPE